MRSIFIIFILMCSLFGKAQTGVYVPQLAAFDAAMTNLLSTYGIPGGQMALTYQGRLVYNRGFGMADVASQTPVQPNSVFRIASISKPITAVAIMKLYEQGLISLDAKVFGATGILNDAIYQNILDPQVTNITVRNLLQHTGGWNRNISGDPMFNAYYIATTMGTTPPADASTVVSYMLQYKMLDFAPGTQSQYSNFGYCVLGRIIEKISGLTYDDYVTNNVFQPAGISNINLGSNLSSQLPNEVTYYDYPGAPLAASVYNNTSMVPWPYGGFNLEAMDAHGGWVSSAEELCRLLVAVDKFSTKPDILLPATIDTMVKPSVQDPYYSCGFSVNSFNNWWHTGSLPGTSTEFVRAGNQQLNWAIMTNFRPANSNNLITDIDNLVWNNLASVVSWPTNDLFTGIADHTAASILIYPLPADDFLHVKNSENLSVSGIVYIYNVVGELISDNPLINSKISVADLKDGIYIARVVTEKEIYSRKIIIKHH